MSISVKNAISPVAVAVAIVMTIVAWRAAEQAEQADNARRHAIEGLRPDVLRLDTYEKVEDEFAAAIESIGTAPQATALLDAAGIPAPSQSQTSEDDPIEGWKTRRANLQWASIPTETALAAVSALSTSTPPWRIERLVIEPLSEAGLSRLDLIAIQPGK